MLVSATEMLKKAVEGHYAVGQFNINNLEWTKSVLLTAQEMNSPVILGVCLLYTSPASSSMVVIMPVVVVLPWVPATPMLWEWVRLM